MIKKWGEFIREFVNEPINVDYINARMQELQDTVMDTQEEQFNDDDFYLGFEWSIDQKASYEDGDIPVNNQGQLNIHFSTVEGEIKFEFDLDGLSLSKIINEEEVEYSKKLSSVEECLDIIEKEIYEYLGVSEAYGNFEDHELTGKRVRIVRLEDPYTNLKPGDEGTVRGVDDMGHILMKWDNGSSLNIIPEMDEFDVIDESINESRIYGCEVLPKKALEELDMYATIDKDKIEVYPDPQVEGTYAVQVTRVGEKPFHLLWYSGGFDEVDFEQFPPKSGKNLNFNW